PPPRHQPAVRSRSALLGVLVGQVPLVATLDPGRPVPHQPVGLLAVHPATLHRPDDLFEGLMPGLVLHDDYAVSTRPRIQAARFAGIAIFSGSPWYWAASVWTMMKSKPLITARSSTTPGSHTVSSGS